MPAGLIKEDADTEPSLKRSRKITAQAFGAGRVLESATEEGKICRFTNTVVRSVVNSMNFSSWESRNNCPVSSAEATT